MRILRGGGSFASSTHCAAVWVFTMPPLHRLCTCYMCVWKPVNPTEGLSHGATRKPKPRCAAMRGSVKKHRVC